MGTSGACEAPHGGLEGSIGRSRQGSKLHILTICLQAHPLEKMTSDVPRVDQYRPIDVFSFLVRLHSSALTAKLRGWLRNVLHPTQYASCGGAGKAVAECNMFAEAALHGTRPVYAISLDFQKLFNSVSPTVASHVAMFLGMSESLARAMTRPLLHSLGVWRLPYNTVCPWESRERGLPQGLASSVALSELFLCVLLRRLHACVKLQSVTYVDDVNIITDSAADLERAMNLIWQFCFDFFLTISSDKTCLWGTHDNELRHMADTWGVQHRTTVEIMGAEWGLKPSSSPDYKKEHARINECRERLRRPATPLFAYSCQSNGSQHWLPILV